MEPVDPIEVSLEIGRIYLIKVDDVILLNLMDDGQFAILTDYTGADIMRFNKLAIGFIKQLREKSHPSH